MHLSITLLTYGKRKIIKKDNLIEALTEVKVLTTKLQELHKQTPVFWYSLNLECNDKEEYTIFINIDKYSINIV